jgi:hypothetical protein
VSPVLPTVKVVGRSTKRVAAAVGEGSIVAALVFTRLAELGVTV